MPPKGRGHLQRAAALIDATPSPLAQYLKESACFGDYSATEVQRVAALSCEGHRGNPEDLLQLARMGASGVHQNHCAHQLDAIIGRDMPADVPVPLPFPVPMRNLKRRLDEDSATDIDTAMTFLADVFFFYIGLSQQSLPSVS